MDILHALAVQAWTLLDSDTYGFVNQAHATYAGREPDQLSGKSIAATWPTADFRQWRRIAAAACADSQRGQCLLDLPDQDGQVQRFVVTFEPLSDELAGQGHVLCTATAAVPTEELTSEHQRIASRAALRERMEAAGRLARETAHELNNSMAVFVGYLDLLQHECRANSAALEYIRRMQQAASASSGIVSNLLRLGGRSLAQPRRANLDEVLRRCIGRLAPTLTDDLHITLDMQASDRETILDADILLDVIRHLLENALEAMNGAGHVAISTQVVDVATASTATAEPMLRGVDHVRLRVEDRGPGLPTDTDLPLIEPMFTTKDRSKHRGVGLSLAYCMAHSLGGAMCVANAPARGVRVDIYLPLVAPIDPELGEESGLDDSAPEEERPRVLVVDDEEPIREIFSRALEDAGFIVATAGDGESAIDMLSNAESRYHLVLLDLMMPGLDGRRTWRRLRTLNPRLQAILVTGCFDGLDEGELLQEGFSRVLAKPIRIADLKAEVKQLSRQMMQASQADVDSA